MLEIKLDALSYEWKIGIIQKYANSPFFHNGPPTIETLNKVFCKIVSVCTNYTYDRCFTADETIILKEVQSLIKEKDELQKFEILITI